MQSVAAAAEAERAPRENIASYQITPHCAVPFIFFP